MGETLALMGLASGCGALFYAWRQMRLRDLARGRMSSTRAIRQVETASVAADHPTVPFARRHRLLPWLIGLMVMASLRATLRLDYPFCLALATIVSLLATLADAMWLGRREALIEQQLADAIDLMVGALHAGASVPTALESALAEIRAPLRGQLEEMLGRLRYGDDPLAVFQALAARVPLDNFRLFSAALAVHWEVGGSLAPTLATVGRTIRDRIEVARRVHSMTTQSRVSTIAILAATYFIALVMWRNDPDRMVNFLNNSLGQSLVSGALVLQAVGIVWAAQIGKVKF
jgi:tight adherence protein B